MIDGLEEYNLFLALHSNQLKQSCIPDIYWHTLFLKLKNQVFDAGENFLMGKIDNNSDDLIVVVSNSSGMAKNSHIYLIDHAWTFEAKDAALQLQAIPDLLQRMSNLMKVPENLPSAEKVDQVCKVMWKYLRTYSRKVLSDEPPITFWYVMDEFGSTINHSSTPTFRAVPFFYQTEQVAYTLLFPIEDVDENDEVTIDYVEGVPADDGRAREALLVPWTDQSFISEPKVRFTPDESYFLSGAHLDQLCASPVALPQPLPNVLKVYTEYSFVRQFLTHPNFLITDDEEDADILWLTKHFSNFKGLAETRPGTFINQFPCERVITTKDLLNIVGRRVHPEPKWLPDTYNLLTELAVFVGEYQRRKVATLDNTWICKPWNLARALDTTVTNNLDCILRLPFSGPKVAQKYVHQPVLFSRPGIGQVKFDIRYVILLVSVQPMKLFCYKNIFLRFANKAYDLNDLWDYEKHFTVMNYRDDSVLHELRSDDFIEEFAVQNPDHRWSEVESRILEAIKEVFVAASTGTPPSALGHHLQSRAIYAADLVLSWENDVMQPLLLEINFAPDCERACRYYPDFYDDVFSLLFKDNINTEKFHIL